MSFQADEPFGPTTAGEEYARQHGRSTDAEVVVAGLDPARGRQRGRRVRRHDRRARRGAGPTADVGRGVVANADGADPLVPGEPIHREAALALADASGATACGEVGPALLTVDDTAPVRRASRPGGRAGGLRPLQHTATRSCWSRHPTSVGRWPFGPAPRRSSPSRHAPRRWRPRTRWSAPSSSGSIRSATPSSWSPPTTQPTQVSACSASTRRSIEPGFLTSGNTRRAGYVLLTDLTPTIANLAGVELDEASIEGRAVERRDGPATGAARRAELVDAEAAARFRDRVLVPRGPDRGHLGRVCSRWSPRPCSSAVGTTVRPWLARVALVLLAFPSLTYLAARLPVPRVGGWPPTGSSSCSGRCWWACSPRCSRAGGWVPWPSATACSSAS